MSRSDLSTLTPALVDSATGGDPRALDEILRTLQRPLFGLALRMLGDRDDAAEATQECLLRIVTRLSTFRSQSKPSTWMWSVAVRSILDFRRGVARRARLTFDGFAEDLSDGLESGSSARAEDRVYLQQVKVGCGRALLQCLDGDHRLAYVLVEIMGFEPIEAARICDVPPPTLRKRLGRARARIRGHLESHCGVVDSRAACRCHRRLGAARKLRRLHPDDSMEVSVAELTQQLDALCGTAVYYRHDRAATPPQAVLTKVKAALQLG